MFAVFSSGGKQHRVTEGEVIKLERLTAEPGEEVVFDKVLIVANGDDVTVGKPYVDGGKVTAEVIGTIGTRKSGSSSSSGARTTCVVRATASGSPSSRLPASAVRR